MTIRMKEMADELKILRKGLFGRRRESIDPNQLHLFEDIDTKAEPVAEVEVKGHTKRKRKGRIPSALAAKRHSG